MKMLRVLSILSLLALPLVTQAQVVGFGGQVASSFATSVSQCPTMPASPLQYFACVVVPGGTTAPFLALSVSGWNGGAPFQLAGLTVNGTVTAGHMVVFSNSSTLQDGGAVPVVPSNIVTMPSLIPSGHAMVSGTNPLNAVDGGAIPSIPSNILTASGPLVPGHALQAGSTSGQVVDAGFVQTAPPNFLNLAAINCKSAALSNGTITCGSGSSIQ